MDAIHQSLVLFQSSLGQILPIKYVSLAAGIIITMVLLVYIFSGIYFRSKLSTFIPISASKSQKSKALSKQKDTATVFILTTILEIVAIITWPLWISVFARILPLKKVNE